MEYACSWYNISEVCEVSDESYQSGLECSWAIDFSASGHRGGGPGAGQSIQGDQAQVSRLLIPRSQTAFFPAATLERSPNSLGTELPGSCIWPILGTALCCFQQMQSFLHGCASMHATQRAPVVPSIAGHASLQLAMPSPKPWAKGCRLCWVAYGLAAAKVEQNNYLQVSRASTYQLALQHTILLVVQNVLAMCATLSALW